MSQQEVRLSVLGAGTVGSQVIRLLGERAEDFAQRSGARLVITGIGDRRPASDQPDWIDPALVTPDLPSLVRDVDLVVELLGGIEPARTLVLQAMANGASVVTANKALLATHGPELFEAAARADVDLYYEAAVAGAVPVVYALRESLAGDTVTRVLGIVNGTTNFILDEMATRGLAFADALAEAQRLGYAEADPTADVDGLDAAAKAALLASLAFHTRVGITDVSVEGIRHVTQADIAQAAADGFALKLLAVCDRVGDDGVSVRVHPTLVPLAHPLAAIHGPFNAVVVEAEAAGRLMFYGRGAGGAPAASAVLGDVVAAAAHRVHGGRAPRESAYAALRVLGPDEVRTAQSVRLRVADEVGVLATVAGIYAQNGVSIESVRQVPSDQDAMITIISHVARAGDLRRTVADLRGCPAVLEVVAVTAVEAG